MEKVGQPHDLRAIMESIQALGSTVASLQLASGRRQTGGQGLRGRPQRIKVQAARQAGVSAPRPRPPPDGQVVIRGQRAASPDNL